MGSSSGARGVSELSASRCTAIRFVRRREEHAIPD
jgi:hypothetical protein